MSIKFSKMHGNGNDFVIIDTENQQWSADHEDIKAMANRRRGIGFDQLLVIGPCKAPSKDSLALCEQGDQNTQGADYSYHIYNADGSEAEQCGNGARCVARYLQRKHPQHSKQWTLISKAGETTVHIAEDNLVTVDMGIPDLTPDNIPFLADHQTKYYPLTINQERYDLGVISMGNPHAVMKVPDLASTPVERIGPAINNDPHFPRGANINFMQIIDKRHIKLRVFERGAGETPACGSGACATAAVAHLWGLCDEDVIISQAGGDLQMHWQGPGQHMSQTGPACFVYDGSWHPEK